MAFFYLALFNHFGVFAGTIVIFKSSNSQTAFAGWQV